MLKNLIMRPLWEMNESETFQIVFKMLLSTSWLLVINFCTYCSTLSRIRLNIYPDKMFFIFLDLPPCASVTEALDKLMWKLLSRRCVEHHPISMFKCLNNLFTHSNIVFKKNHHGYNTRCKDNVHKAISNRKWGICTSTNFAANEWNNLDKSFWHYFNYL